VSSFSELGYLGLFVSSFLSATILPLSSEVVLALIVASGYDSFYMLLVATTVNVLGSVVNYFLGYYLATRWIDKKSTKLEKAQERFEKYGLPSLLFAWVPIVGDPLTVIAGVFRVSFLWFIALVTIGKLGRYVVVLLLV
jgi:membrane protein YqaA with SNARE-associated domain